MVDCHENSRNVDFFFDIPTKLKCSCVSCVKENAILHQKNRRFDVLLFCVGGGRVATIFQVVECQFLPVTTYYKHLRDYFIIKDNSDFITANLVGKIKLLFFLTKLIR